MADQEEPFRFVSAEEFRKMNARQRSDYLMRAVQELIRKLKQKAAEESRKKKR